MPIPKILLIFVSPSLITHLSFLWISQATAFILASFYISYHMAGEEILILGGLGVGAVLLLKPELLQQFIPQPAAAVPTAPVSESVPQAVQTTPGIQAIIVTPDILLQANVTYLIVIPRCELDDIIFSDPDAFSVVKIWDVQYNQIATTVFERNQLALLRCNILHWYRNININITYSDPIREHIRRNKLVIINDFHRGQRDSPAANSAAHQVAQVTTPISVNCKNCTVNINNTVGIQQQAKPTNNTPPIHPAASAIGQGGAVTTPVTTHACPHGSAWSASAARCMPTSIVNQVGNLTQTQAQFGRAYYGRRW